MDDLWGHIKCGSPWAPPASLPPPPRPPPLPSLVVPPLVVAASQVLPPASWNQMDVNLHQKFCSSSQEVNVGHHAFVQEPMGFSSLNTGSCKPSKTDMGNSFLALLSGPSHPLSTEFPGLLKSGPSMFCNKFPAGDIGNAASGINCSVTVPYISALPLHHAGNRIANGVEHSSYSMARSPFTSACSQPPVFCNDFQVLGFPFPSSSADKPVRLCSLQGSEGELAVSSTSKTNASQQQKSNVYTHPTRQLDARTNVFSHASSFIRGCPRVFCMDKVGELFVSDNGLLGVFCLCHSLRMSVAKFCEHSGSHDLNPGDAVYLENGETVAQWRRLFFLNIGVRVPDDGSGWDWPDGTFMPGSGSLHRPKANNLPNSKNAESFPLQEPFSEIGRSKGLPNGHTSHYPYMGTTALEKLLNKLQENTEHRNSHEGVHKGFTGSTHSASSVPIIEHMPKAAKENCAFEDPSALKPALTTRQQKSGKNLIMNDVGGVRKSGNFSTLYPSSVPLQPFVSGFNTNGITIAGNAHFVDRDSTPSNIELKLGQPSQRNHNFMPTTDTVCPQQFLAKLEPQRQPIHQLISQGPVISRVLEKPTQNLHCNSSEVQTSSLLRHGGSMDLIQVSEEEVAKSDLDKNSLISLFLSHFSTSEGKTKSQLVENITSRCENVVPSMVGCTSLSAKCSMINFSRNASNGIERKSNMNTTEFSNQIENGKGLIISLENEFCTEKPNSSGQNKQVRDLRVFAESNDGRSCYNTCLSDRQNTACFHQSFSRTLEEPDARHSSDFGQNFVSPITDTHDNGLPRYQGARTASLSASPTNSFFSSNPIYISGTTPSLLNKMNTDLTRHLVDENMRFPQLKQAHLPASIEMNVQQGQLCCPSTVGILKKGSREELVASEDFRHGQHCSTGQEASTIAFRTRHPCCNCCSCGVVENLCGKAGTTGKNRISNQTCCIQDISLYSKEPHVKSPSCPACSDDEHSYLRLFRADNKVTESVEQEISSQKEGSSYVPGKCSCKFHAKCLKGCHIYRGEGHPNSTKEHVICGKNHMLLSPAYDIEHPSQDGKRIALGQCDGLRQLIVNDDCRSALGRDASCKALGNSDAITLQNTADTLPAAGSIGNQLANSAAKSFDGTHEEANSIKEQHISNIYSACSAPVVTEVSVEENNLDSCTGVTGDARSLFDLVVDEGSVIEKCGSSDDVFDNTRWDNAVTAKGKMDPQKVSDHASCHTSKSKLDETNEQSDDFVREINFKRSSIPRKKRNQFHAECPVNESDKLGEPIIRGWRAERKNKATKWRRLDGSFTASGLSLIHKDSTSDGHLGLQYSSKGMESPGHSGNIVQKVCINSNKRSGVKRKCYALTSAESLSWRVPDGHHSVCKADVQMPSGSHNSSNTMYKTSTGTKGKKHFTTDEKEEIKEQEKNPEMAGSLLKYIASGTKRCSTGGMCPGVKLVRPVVRGNSGVISNGYLSGKSKPVKIVSLNSVLKLATKRHNVSENEKEPSDASNLQMENAGCFSSKGEIHGLSVTKRGKDTGFGTFASNFNVQVKPRCKETRKRRLSELTKNVKDTKVTLCLPTFGESHCSVSMQAGCHQKKSTMTVASDDLVGAHLQHKKGQIRPFSKFSRQPYLRGEIPQEGQDHAVEFCDANAIKFSNKGRRSQQSEVDSDAFCCVCGSSNKDDLNHLLECNNCLIRVHQACYGVLKVPKGHWFCRPCRTNSKDIACVLCGYEGGAMTRAVRSRNIVKGLLKTWKEGTGYLSVKSAPMLAGDGDVTFNTCSKVQNSIVAGALDPTVTQWVHVVCGLWTPGTRCPNVDTMSAFDVSGVLPAMRRTVCSMCNRPGGSCIQCRVVGCSVHFHPWCAHEKGLLQSEIEGVDNENVGFYGRCLLHAAHHNYHSDDTPMDAGVESPGIKEYSCARTEGYKGRKKEHGSIHTLQSPSNDDGRCIVPQEQLDAWLHINGQKPCPRGSLKPPASETDYDCRKEYARYKQAKGWKHLVVYKSRIHALGLYTSQFIPRGAMVVEYVGEIVGLRVADKREIEYQSGKKLQYKSACYFFRIDKGHIIDATRKGGIARFVNHSCLPNCVAKVISVRNEKKVVFFAERDINPGEEITYDYNFNHEEEGKKIPCFCNSKNCRRYLN